MAATSGVLSFVRGVDFSRNDFQADLFPSGIKNMTGLRWLKLNDTEIERVPDELSNLKDLEHLHMNHNKLSSVHGELSDLPRLRSVIVRHNQVKTSGIPSDIFRMKDLTIIDFSNNQLKDVPSSLEQAKTAIVLNLSHNCIETIPNQVFMNMVDLLYLDLSSNKLEVLPPQIRRLTELQELNLSDNPLAHLQLKQLPNMTSLRVLHMANTQRNASNIPPSLDNLINLEDVDFSRNQLDHVPDALFSLKNLRKLSMQDNKIGEIRSHIDVYWEKMECLNLSRNCLKALPDAITKMSKLRKLLLNENELDFQGVPSGVGKLVLLESFQAAYNNLELVPEGFGRCVKLKKLKLNNNRLITIPDGIQLLPDLVELDVRNNPELVMPPKPTERKKLAYYNIDFSLEHHMRLAGGGVAGLSPASSLSSSPSAQSASTIPRDPVARKIQFLRRRKGQTEADSDQRKILQGMTEIAKERERVLAEEQTDLLPLKPKKLVENLENQRPHVDYSDVFDEDAGQKPGLTVWEIEHFLPNPLDEAFHGNFYEGDCYIVLKTIQEENGNLSWLIYYWIGEKASLDKKACSAIQAVNLRNYLGATCRCSRQEMNDEDDEFLELFGEEIVYIEGGRTSSGFYTVEAVEYSTRLYRISSGIGAAAQQIHVEPVALTSDSLDPRFVFLLDAGLRMFVWAGRKSKGVLRSKTRLFAEKVNKNERKYRSEIESCLQGHEADGFWMLLCGSDEVPLNPVVEHVPSDFLPRQPILYQVKLGMGYLELPQVEFKRGALKQPLLQSRGVYLLDCHTELFLWIGKKSTRLVRAAGVKLSNELHAIMNRPEHSILSRVCEGTESMLFKSKFVGWDDVMAVDFTRTAESVQRRGADLKVIMERDKMKTDLAGLFLDRQEIMSDADAELVIQDCNYDLELMEPFVLEGRKFVRLPDQEFGTFCTMDCYVFLCRYWVPPEDDDDEKEKSDRGSNADSETEHDHKPDFNEKPDDFQCVVYFWQGRDASNMGWLTFTFSLQKKFENLFKDKLEVVRMHQQQENHKFLSHFKKRFLIRKGRRNMNQFPGAGLWAEMFHLRANGSAVCTRTIQIDCSSDQLNSEFVYIVRAPYRTIQENGMKGRVYVWAGARANPNEVETAVMVATELVNRDDFPLKEITEGEEPTDFWDAFVGDRKPYETVADFVRFARLFRCTNEKGYFAVSEKTIDFCQDDLDDDDIMILDNGDQVFLWVGARASEVEVKLAYKAAQVYLQHLRLKQPDRPRKLMLTLKGKESKRFTKCFHAWSKHKLPAGD